MEIIKNFGLDPMLLGAQIVNFLVIFYLLKRFLFKPVLTILKNREKTISEGLKKAEEARILLEKTTEKEKEILKNAQKEALKIMGDAKKQAVEFRNQTEEDAKKQAERIIGEAKMQIGEETKRVEQQLAANVSALAVQFLQKTVREFFGKKEQDEIMEKAIKQIKGKAN